MYWVFHFLSKRVSAAASWFLTKSQFVCLPFGTASVLETLQKLFPVPLPSLFSSFSFEGGSNSDAFLTRI